MPREVVFQYADPLDLVWLKTAERCGFRVERSGEVYASYDGKGTITLSSTEHMDADDCLAQMIFHELCHALVQGPEAIHWVDWGLSVEGLDALEEHATHRVQAALADRHGLRMFFGVTTDWRPYFDALPADPLEGESPETQLAKMAWERATSGPWAQPIEEALQATAAFQQVVQRFTDRHSLWRAGLR